MDAPSLCGSTCRRHIDHEEPHGDDAGDSFPLGGR